MRRNNIAVNVIDEQRRLNISAKKVKEFSKLVLRRYGIKKAELNILITDAPRMRALNKRFLRRDSATDVLAFNAGAARGAQADNGAIRADIAVSSEAAIRRCKEFHTTAADELKLYLIHAILHILGYDDRKTEDASLMRREERAALGKLCGMEIS